MIIRFYTLIVLLTTICFQSFSQKYSVGNKKAVKNYQNAVEAFDKYQNVKALEWINKALDEENDFVEAWLLKAELMHQFDDIETEIQCLRKALEINPRFYPIAFYNLSTAEFSMGLYTQAYNTALKASEYISPAFPQYPYVEDLLKRTRFALELFQHPADIEIINCGSEINSRYNDYWPTITADEQTLIWTVMLEKNNALPKIYHQEDFFVSNKINGKWTLKRPVGAPINTDDNEGAISLSADGRTCYFTACNRKDAVGRCDIYKSVLVGDKWSIPVNLGNIVNSPANDKQPSISADGRILYFSSDRSGGYGKMDIWYSVADSTGNWQQPVNAGDSVNTPGNEEAPFIHFDGKTLFFSSDGHYGMGSVDIFRTVKTVNGYTKPVNLGYPINTNKEEIGLIINARGTTAYYAAEKDGGYGGLDLYHFELPANLQPDKVIYVKGYVTDAITGIPLAANISLSNLVLTDEKTAVISDSVNGFYLVCLKSGYNYSLYAQKDGYLFHSEFFSLSVADSATDFLLDIKLRPIAKNEKVVLNNIFFETGSAALKPESFAEIEKIWQLMLQNQDIKIEISGHTDNTGERDFNMRLSEARAEKVYQYLIKKGIAKERLSYKGYADTVPVAGNETAAGRALNRRTEMVIR